MPRDFGCRGESLNVYDPTGAKVLTVGVEPDGSAGLISRDASSDPLVYVGQLPDGTHGLMVLNANGRVLFKVTSEGGQIAPSPTLAAQSASGYLSGSASQGFRPGSPLGTYVELWRTDFWSVGSKIDYDLSVYANAGNMTWQILCYEYGGASSTVAVGPTTETTNTQRSGTFTIPTAGLANGTDPAGRNMTIRVQAKINSGATTADVAVNGPFINHN